MELHIQVATNKHEMVELRCTRNYEQVTPPDPELVESLKLQAKQTCRQLLDKLPPELLIYISKLAAATGYIESNIVRPDGSVYISYRSYLLVRLVVNSTQSFIPVLFQVIKPTKSVPSLDSQAIGEISEEIESALTAQVLKKPWSGSVVLSPRTAAQMVHECFGHTCEADNYLTMRKHTSFGIGDRWSEFPLSIIDDPQHQFACGSYDYDMDGSPARRKRLIDKGVWQNLLVNSALIEKVNLEGGNGRRTLGNPSTLPRMSVTWAESGIHAPEQLIAMVDDGIYCTGTWGGLSGVDDFLVRPTFGKRIKHGQLTNERIRCFDFVGLKRETAMNIAGMGNDLQFFDTFSGCDKKRHDQLPVTNGSPHMFLKTAHLKPIASKRS